MKIKTGDKIIAIAGKNKGKSGKVIQTIPATKKVVVEGLNIVKKHIKPQSGKKGQIIELSAPFNASNVLIFCERCGKGTRAGYRVEADKKVRFCKKCKEVI